MSAKLEDVEDFEQVTPVVPPAKKAPRPAPKPTHPAVKSEDEIRAEVQAALDKESEIRARIEAELRAEIEADLRAELLSRKVDASVEDIDETPYPHITPAPGEEVIHMVEDGLTFGNKVFMRGQELALNPEEQPWINNSRAQQIRQFGKQLFAKGPWPYGGYDLTDPELTPEDKRRLIDATSDSNFG